MEIKPMEGDTKEMFALITSGFLTFLMFALILTVIIVSRQSYINQAVSASNQLACDTCSAQNKGYFCFDTLRKAGYCASVPVVGAQYVSCVACGTTVPSTYR